MNYSSLQKRMKYGLKPWENPKMTDYSNADGWTVESTVRPTSNGAIGFLAYKLFSDGSLGMSEMYAQYGGYIDLVAPRKVFLKEFLPMVGLSAGYYRNGVACTLTAFNDGVATTLGAYYYTNGLVLPDYVIADRIRASGFIGGYQADDLCHCFSGIPIKGVQL